MPGKKKKDNSPVKIIIHTYEYRGMIISPYAEINNTNFDAYRERLKYYLAVGTKI